MTSRTMNEFKYRFIYTKKIQVDRILHLPYFENFGCVEMTNTMSKYPKNAKRVHFFAYSNIIPSGVTHLVFSFDFDQPIKDCIPSSVTHLTFGDHFDQPIKDCIPSSVTHLEFGFGFNNSINGSIPPSVTHLIFGYYFDRSIRGNIPFGVTHLVFDVSFNKRIKNSKDHMGRIVRAIPASVIYLEFGNYFNQAIKDYIPSSVTCIKFGYHFNQSINGLPSSVKKIYLPLNYRKPIDANITTRTKITRC